MSHGFQLTPPPNGGPSGPITPEKKPLQDAETHRATVEDRIPKPPRLFEGIPAQQRYLGDEEDEKSED